MSLVQGYAFFFFFFELWMYVIGEGLGKIFTALWYFFNLFSAASWEIYKALLKLVKWVLSCPLLMSMSEALSVTCTLSNIYTKLWVIETVFCPRVNSSPSETTDLVTSFNIHCKLSQPTPVFLPGKPDGQRSLAGHCPKGQSQTQLTMQGWHGYMSSFFSFF